MADTDKTLKLLIDMGVIGMDDAQAANDLLAEAKTGTEKLADVEKTAAGSTEKLEINHRALHQIMHLIGKETAPELGHALTGALYGPIGIALAVGYAFEGIRNHIADTNKELDEMGKKAAEAYASVKTNLFDAIRDEEFSTEKVDKFFKKIEDDAGNAQKAIESALKIAHELETADISKLKADEANEIAKTKADQSLSPERKEALEAAIKNKYAGLIAGQEEKGNLADVDAARAVLAQKQQELDNLLMQQHQGESALSPVQLDALRKAGFTGDAGSAQGVIAQWSSANAKQNSEKAQKDLPDDEAKSRKLHAENDDAIGALNGRIQEQVEALKNPNLSRGDKFNHQMLLDAFNIQLASLMKSSGVEAADAKVASDKKYIEQQKTAEAVLRQQADELTKLNSEIEKLREAVIEAQQNLKETGTIAGIKNDAIGYGQNKGADTAVYDLLAKLGGQKLDASQQAEISAVRAMIAQAHGNSQAILQLILDGHKKNESLDQIIRQIQYQINNSRNRSSG